MKLVPFTGRLGMKQYHKDKPTKWGVKIWMLCTAQEGYLYNFEVYKGKATENEQLSGPSKLTVYVVLDLVRSMANTGRHVYFDRFYTSRALLYRLRQANILACGTVMTNRQFPKYIVPATKNTVSTLIRCCWSCISENTTGTVVIVCSRS